MTNDNHKSSTDDTWADFVNAHSEELESIEKSRKAKKFEKNASRIDEQKSTKRPTLRIKSINDDVFVNNTTTPRGYSTSWLDADDDHFHAPNPSWSSVTTSSVIAAVLVIIGFGSIFAAAAFPAVRSLCALIAGISLILAFGILGTMHRSRTNSASNRHNDGARI